MVRPSDSSEANIEQITPFKLIVPDVLTHPLMLASPHSGRLYPSCFLRGSRLNQTSLRRSEDFCVDDLFSFAPGLDTPLLSAKFPRSFVDVNRSNAEIDPALLYEHERTYQPAVSKRVANGLGVVPRVVGAGIEIYDEAIGLSQVEQRLKAFHTPYHTCLREQLERIKAQFGSAVLFDCHSMPDTVSSRRTAGHKSCDIVLGDRFGATCSKDIVDAAETMLCDLGYRVVRNDPYAGGYTTSRYGKPQYGFHALQIEINRRLYMDERRLRLSAGYARLKDDLETFITNMIPICLTAVTLKQGSIAAE